jgi:hypothetical protein
VQAGIVRERPLQIPKNPTIDAGLCVMDARTSPWTHEQGRDKGHHHFVCLEIVEGALCRQINKE